MNVALANYEYPPDCGGGGEFTASLADELERDHDVQLVVGDRDGATSSTASLVSWPFRTAGSLRQAASQADVLNCHFTVPTSLLAPVLSGETPVVVNAMGADVFDPTRYSRVRPLLSALNYGIAAGADRLVVPSTDLYARLPEAAQDKARIIPYFVDHERYHPPARQQAHDPLRLLSVCRLVERKNLQAAIRAVAQLVKRGVDVEYTIAGAGPRRAALRDLADDLGVADAVTFAGFVPEDDLPDLYRRNDIFVLPSEHEAFGIAVLEALSSGLPCLVSSTGGQTDIVTADVGRCVSPDAGGAIAGAVETLEANYEEYATAARERVLGHYTADAVVPQYESLYTEVSK